ncbi:nucleotidyltransferase family protein [Microbacterium sp. NPDC056052]|uniref:nucleotidyltransferase family protein n=1 Tax=Microbacterium sp. NPDC056052 TaxID=3345695 RepID=UPI0035DB4048
MSSTFALSAGNDLAHALMAHLAAGAGIRVLSIKGFVADRYGLREPRVAADADVLIEPSRFDDFCALLSARGWRLRHERQVPSLMAQHSATYIHDGWPNDIDAHIYFPGFFGRYEDAFDALWSSRSTMTIAQTEVNVPSRAGATVIAALHALRYTHSSRHVGELTQVKRVLADDFSDEEREQFVEVARAGGALWVLQEVLAGIGVSENPDATPAQQLLWNTNRATIEDGAAVSWLTALRGERWYRKPVVIFHALWISREEIPRNDPNTLPTALEAWRHRTMRWRRGAVALLHYVRLRLFKQ